jgi:hypothetical protein
MVKSSSLHFTSIEHCSSFASTAATMPEGLPTEQGSRNPKEEDITISNQ